MQIDRSEGAELDELYGGAQADALGVLPEGPGGASEMSALDELEMQHDQAKHDIEAIRREFGL